MSNQTTDYRLFSEEEEMKFKIVLAFVIISSVLLAGCQQAGEGSVLEKIQDANKVVVGTSADYPPYEYIDETGKMTGFDIELMEEIANRMGVAIEWQDMPFDSLIAAVQEKRSICRSPVSITLKNGINWWIFLTPTIPPRMPSL
jgi:hypothetical protein